MIFKNFSIEDSTYYMMNISCFTPISLVCKKLMRYSSQTDVPIY